MDGQSKHEHNDDKENGDAEESVNGNAEESVNGNMNEYTKQTLKGFVGLTMLPVLRD